MSTNTTPAGFPIYTAENAPETSRASLKEAQKAFGGTLPNLFAILGGSPELLAANGALMAQVGHTSLSALEQQVVELAVSQQNHCGYCVSAHLFFARTLPQGPVTAAANGAPITGDAKLEALRRFAVEMVRTSGRPDAVTTKAFFAHYNQRQALEVILLLTLKTLHNLVNNFAETPVDLLFARAHAAQ